LGLGADGDALAIFRTLGSTNPIMERKKIKKTLIMERKGYLGTMNDDAFQVTSLSSAVFALILYH
jgi:hypothetical protein